MSPEGLLGLQRTLGNRVTSDLVDSDGSGGYIDELDDIPEPQFSPYAGGSGRGGGYIDELDDIPEPEFSPYAGGGGRGYVDELDSVLGDRRGDASPPVADLSQLLGPDASVDELRAMWNNRVAPTYHSTKDLVGGHGDEDTDSSTLVNILLKSDIKQYFRGRGKGIYQDIPSMIKARFGWSDSDIERIVGTRELSHLRVDPEATKVDYLDEEARKGYEVWGGPQLRYGPDGETFNTAQMFSKFLGKGFAIFVMDTGGTMYAGEHKVGLFHHSSFLSGGSIAAAGEIKVTNGRVEAISNKSGHYRPDEDHMVQALAELRRRGVNLAGVDVHLLNTGDMRATKLDEDAATWLQENYWLIEDDDDEDEG